MERYEQRHITKFLGIKRPLLQQLIERGFVSPSIEKAGALGKRNGSNRADMFKLAEFNELTNRGFSRKEASQFLKSYKVVRAWGKKVEIVEWNKKDKDSGPEREDLLGIEYHAVQILVSEDPREKITLSGLLIPFILEVRKNKFFPTFAKAAKCLGLDTHTIRTIKTVNLTKARKNVASKLK